MSEAGEDRSSNIVPSLSAAPSENIGAEFQQLPPEMQTVVSIVAGIFRSTSGPDPETARIVAQSEMHEESCRLEGYRESLKNRDLQSERDHAFRTKRLNHDTIKSMVQLSVCVILMICGLYLLVWEHNSNIGVPLLIAGFSTMGGGKLTFSKEKE